DIISFHGTSVDSLKKAFAESVDDYITSCKSFGCLPNKPASGRFIVRTNPKIHSQLIQNAQMAGLSTNKYVEKIITHNLSTF
ncbi:MAG: toxin-antitoxin system HicB family antitoxin, partial [Gammaproteobacteria bacterium]